MNTNHTEAGNSHTGVYVSTVNKFRCLTVFTGVCEGVCLLYIRGVSRMTEVTIREQMMRITSRAMAIPFQFLCGGALPTRS